MFYMDTVFCRLPNCLIQYFFAGEKQKTKLGTVIPLFFLLLLKCHSHIKNSQDILEGNKYVSSDVQIGKCYNRH